MSRRHSAVVVVVGDVAAHRNAAAAVVVAVAGTVDAVDGLLMLLTRLACVDSMVMAFGHFGKQTTTAVWDGVGVDCPPGEGGGALGGQLGVVEAEGSMVTKGWAWSGAVDP